MEFLEKWRHEREERVHAPILDKYAVFMLSGLRYLGKLIKAVGWIVVILAITFLYIVPFIETAGNGLTEELVYTWIKQTFFTVPSIFQLLTVFIPLGLLIWAGKYLIELSREREARLEAEFIGFLRSYGRIPLADLSNRLGSSIADTERYLARIRGKRDIVFTISDGLVIMPGFERSRPIKEVEKITREIVTTACRYCGTLIPMDSTVCLECGANLKKVT